MLNNYGTTRIFAETELSQVLNNRLNKIFDEINSEKKDYILNVNDNDYIKHKISKAYIEELKILEENIYASESEQMIPSDYFPSNINVYKGKKYKKSVIKFHIPFSGNQGLLSCMPSERILWSINVDISENEFSFEIINFSNDAETIKREKDSNINSILKQLDYISNDIKRYNNNIEQQIKNVFDKRKEQILAQTDVLSSLGVPIKKTSSLSETFSIPSPQKRKKVTISRPKVDESKFVPEPSLDNSIYTEILQLIHDVGKEFERLPSLYKGKEEEHLRDHFLMMLEPNFEGSATGETFNKSGKTDILLRYKSSNVFIAECKFWRGKKVFIDTISQLLNYLTWRDSKAAVIMFVPNKDFTTVIETSKKYINEHPNFITMINEKDETWLNYEFHLNNDRNRIVKMAVMLYHIPKS